MEESQERTWILIIHLSGFLGGLVLGFGCLIVPLVLWLLKRDASPRIDLHGKEVVNFQISLVLFGFVILAIGAVAAFALGMAIFLAIPLVWLVFAGLFLCQWICGIIGTVKASEGKDFLYPLNLRLIS